MKKFRFPLLILLSAFVLRLVALNTRAVWYDEAFAFFLAQQDLPRIASGTAADTMPPLYYALLHYWMPLVGTTPFALRMLTVALSMLFVALIYAIAKRAFNARVGTWAMVFTALAPFELYHAQEMRMYTSLALAGVLYLYSIITLSFSGEGNKGEGKSLVLVAFSTALALYSHNLAFLTLGAANVYFIITRDWRAFLKLCAAQLVGALLFVPWLFYVPTQIAKIENAFWTQPPNFADVIQMIVVFTGYLPLPDVLFYLVVFATLMIFIVAVIELVRVARRGASPAFGMLATFALIPPALMFVLSYIFYPIFVPRGVIVSSLAYYILLAFILARARFSIRVGAGVVVVLLVAVMLPSFYSSWGEWRRAPFAQADAFLRAQSRGGDLILHDNKLSFFSMHYYDPALPQEFLADPPGSANDTLARGSMDAFNLYPIDWIAAFQRHVRIWFVIFQTALDQAPPEGHPNLLRLDAAMKRVSVTPFGDLRIYLYENP